MKKSVLISLLAGCSICFAQCVANAQEFKEHISKQFTLQQAVSATTVAVYNLSGSVKVEGYAGDKVIIEVDKTINAKNAQALDRAKSEVKIVFEQNADSVIAYLAEPYYTKPHHNSHYHYDSNDPRNYDFDLQFTVKVPYNVNLAASTINDGDVTVSNVTGKLKVNNINGPITITNAKGITDANTINGNLIITYAAVPPEASNYYTLNGKLQVTYPASLSADLQFKSMNGQFYTDFPDAEIMPAQVVKSEQKKNNTTIFKMDKNTKIRVGSGGKLFKFETLNGNIYIKKQS